MIRFRHAVVVAVGAAALVACGPRAPHREAATAASAEAAAEPAPAPEPEGTYVGVGTDPQGKAYKCEVDVMPAGEVYFIVRRFEGRVAYDGVGIRHGALLVVAWRDEFRRGVIVYTLNADGSLTGTSAYEDNTHVGTEVLKKKSSGRR